MLFTSSTCTCCCLHFYPPSPLLLPDPAAVNSVSLKCAIIIHSTRQASFCFPGCYSCCLFLFLFVYSCGNSPLNASSDIYFLRLSFSPLCRVRLRLTLTRRLRRKHKKKQKNNNFGFHSAASGETQAESAQRTLTAARKLLRRRGKSFYGSLTEENERGHMQLEGHS